jgi:hypothetical protein
MIGLLAGAHPVIPPTRAPDPSPESHRPLPLRRHSGSDAESAACEQYQGEGVAAGHSAAPRRLQETGVSTH